MAMAPVIENDSGGARVVNLHPLVIINISEHFTRACLAGDQGSVNRQKIYGLLFGVQNGLVVDIYNSFEVPASRGDSGRSGTEFNKEYVESIKEQYAASKDLPVTMYESEIHVQNDIPTMILVRTAYKIETLETERIGIDHIAKVSPTDGSSSLGLHLDAVKTAVTKVDDRIQVLLQYLEQTKSGDVAPDHRLLRQLSRVCNQLPVVDAPSFRTEFLKEYNDTLLLTYLASMTKGTASVNDLVDKFLLMHDPRKKGSL